jgi:hypothetical protein
MIRKSLLLVCALTLFGCSYGQDYLENPDTFIRDPHFAGYQKKRDNLEKSYLRRDITYAQYMEERNQIDETYAQEVQERDNKIMSSP